MWNVVRHVFQSRLHFAALQSQNKISLSLDFNTVLVQEVYGVCLVHRDTMIPR